MVRAKKYELIIGPIRIARLTGHYVSNPKPRCGKCGKPTVKAEYDQGPKVFPRKVEIGRWCKVCKILYQKEPVIRHEYVEGEEKV